MHQSSCTVVVKAFGFNDIIKHCCDVSVHGNMHVFVLIRGAMLLYWYVGKVTSTAGCPFQASG